LRNGADHLGSSRVVTNATGTVCYEADFYPYGGERAVTTTCAQNYKFTGKERDAETGNDNFGARYYPNNLGRFLTPDPLMASGRASNPQSWNRYAYTLNNPLRFIDPNGLEEQPCATTDQECAKRRQAANGKGKVTVTAGITILEPVTSDDRQAQKQQNSCGFLRRLGQRIVNGLTGYGFRTNEQLTPVVTTKIISKPNFYSASVTVGVASQSLTYVPSTNNLYYAGGPGLGTGVALTAGKASDPNGFASGPSASACFFAGAGICAGASTSGDTAVQVGVGVGGWSVSSGYGIDPVSTFLNEAYENLPAESATPTFPAGGMQWEDPDWGIPH
jgi:RHS repeat-associated protein